MKIIIKLIPIILFMIIIMGCEESFNPYSELKDETQIYCILNSSKSFQTAKITKSYLGDNLDSDSYTTEPNVTGAKIWIRWEDSVVVFNEGFYERTDSTKYGNVTHYYYNDNFVPKEDTQYDLEALLPDGKRLTSLIITPPDVRFMWTVSQKTYPPTDPMQTAIGYQWNQNLIDAGHYYASRLMIYYSREGGPVEEYVVPINYRDENGERVGVYTGISLDTWASYREIIIDEAMARLSDNEPLKNKFTVYGMACEVTLINRTLHNYYRSTVEMRESISLVINSSYYSNINGGKGIFGYLTTERFPTSFSREYVTSFGYNYASLGDMHENDN